MTEAGANAGRRAPWVGVGCSGGTVTEAEIGAGAVAGVGNRFSGGMVPERAARGGSGSPEAGGVAAGGARGGGAGGRFGS